jgi:hypothetical protein
MEKAEEDAASRYLLGRRSSPLLLHLHFPQNRTVPAHMLFHSFAVKGAPFGSGAI